MSKIRANPVVVQDSPQPNPSGISVIRNRCGESLKNCALPLRRRPDVWAIPVGSIPSTLAFLSADIEESDAG